MSVIVKGMEMPISCKSCKFSWCIGGGDWFCTIEYEPNDAVDVGEFWRLVKNGEKSRPGWCPLHPLPVKHGRLKDVDAIIEDIRKNSESYFADDFAHEWIERQPTIVEAEV